jgi:methyl-accepting chemotaxis protein
VKLRNWLHLNIFPKILVTMLVVAIAPLSAIWYIDYRSSVAQLETSIDQRLGDASDKLVDQVNAWVTMNLKALNQNAALPDMLSMDPKRQNPILITLVNEYNWALRVFTTALDGHTLGKSDDAPVIDYSDRIYFKQVMGGAPMGKQVIISRVTGKPAVVLAAPIKKPDSSSGTKTLIGMIAMTLHITDISEAITKQRIGRTGFAFLLDEEGKVVAHQKEEYAIKSADFNKHPAYLGRPDQGAKRLLYEDNGKRVIAYVQKTTPGWILVTQQDYEEAYAPIREANRKALILLGVTLILVTVIAYWFSERMAKPIRNLTRVADEMSHGKLAVRIVEVDRKDEIGALASAIDRMGQSIRIAIERISAKSSPRV